MKITESKLTSIIENSVKKHLNEIDWKTYMNASRKAERNNDPRARDFFNAAEKDFREKHGYGGENSFNSVGLSQSDRVGGAPGVYGKSAYQPGRDEFDNYGTATIDGYAHSGIDGSEGREHFYERPLDRQNWRSFNNGNEDQALSRKPEVQKAYTNAKQEVQNYANGNYRYDQNKGWTLQEQKLKNYIKKLVREMIEMDGGMNQFEDNYKADYPHKGENEKKPLHNPNGTSDQNNENQEEEQLRSSVEKFFQSPSKSGRKVDIAGYAYQLDGIHPKEGEDSNEMKNSRSLFMKKLNHEPNDQGYPYSFSTDEINRLASMISSNNKMNESRRRRK